MANHSPEFAHLTTTELRLLLADVLKHAVPSDQPFIKRLAGELVARGPRGLTDARTHHDAPPPR